MAAMVILCTSYALILPAITMTDTYQALACPLDIHGHTASCYDSENHLICGKADFVVHVHNSDCYDAEGNLVCRLPEIKAHEHTASCYKEEKRLICTTEENQGHQHSADCYAKEQGNLICTSEDPEHIHTDECFEWNDVLTCGREEGEGSHTHTGDCYETAKALICSNAAVLHKHTNSCYDAGGNLTCGQPEVLEHVHGNGCFVETEIEKTDPETAEPDEVHNDEMVTEPVGEFTDGEITGSEENELEGIDIIEDSEDSALEETENTGDASGEEITEPAEDVSEKETTEPAGDTTEEEATESAGDTTEGATEPAEDAFEEETTESAEDASEEETTEPVEDASEEETTEPDENAFGDEMMESEETEYPEEELSTNPGIAYPPFNGDETAEAYLLPGEDFAVNAKNVMMMLAETDPYDLANYITSVTIKRRAQGENLWQDIVGDNVKVDDELLFDLNYTIGERKLDDTHRTVTYQINKSVKILKEDRGKVKDGNGNEVGDYLIDTDGKITITFTEEYAKGNADGSKIVGHIAFESSVKDMGGSAGGDITIPFEKDYILHVKNTSGDLTVTKTSKNVVSTDGTLDYEITVSSVGGTGDKVTLNDVMTNVAMAENANLTVKRNGELLTEGNGGYTYTKNESGNFCIELPQMSKGDKYVIFYSAKTTSTPQLAGFITATNKVTASSTDSANVPVTDDDTVTDVFTKKLIEKSGVANEDGTVTWTIRLNSGEAKLDNGKTQRADISGWTLKDVMNGIEYNGKVTISPNPQTGEGALDNVELPYTFPANSHRVEYTVTYTTKGAMDTSNTATLFPPKGTGAGTTVQPGEVSITKAARGYELLDRDANGDLLLRMDWNLTVDATSCAIPADRTGTLLGRPMRTDKDNGWPGYWYFSDYAQQGQILHYYTPEQLKAAAQNIATAIGNTGYVGNYYIFACEGTWEYTDNLVLIQKGGEADNFWDNAYLNGVAPGKNINDGKNRNYLYVLFDKELERGTTFSFDYSTTANLGQGVNTIQISNHAEIHTKSLSPGTTEFQTYYATVAKFDGRKGSSSIGTKTEYLMGTSLDYDAENKTFDNVLRWNIRIRFPEGASYSDPVVITEKLPEGLEVLKLSTTGGRSKYALYVNFGTSTESPNDIFKGYNCWFGEGNNVSYENGKGTVTPGINQCNNIYGEYTVHFARNETNDTYTITVPYDLANKLSATGGIGMVYVAAQIEDPTGWTGIEESFVNTATVKTGGKKMGEASHEQVVKREVISKDSSGYNAEEDPSEIPYVLTINPDRADLVANSDTLTLTDVLTFTPPAGANINARLEDVKIINSSTKKDLTDQCPYTTAGETTDSKVTRTFTMTIPDSTPLTVTYTYKMSGTGQVKDFKNVATVAGVGHESSSDENEMVITVQKSQAGADLVGINVYKVDGQNYNLHLDDAEFNLEKWDDEKQEWVKVNENSFVTGTNINAGTDKDKQGTFNTGDLTANTAYCLIETEAPSPAYVLDATPYYFYIVQTGKDAPADCMPEGFRTGSYEVDGKPHKVARLNPGDHIDIPNDHAGYELPETGGAGTIRYIIWGLLLIAGVGIFLLETGRRQNKMTR